MRELLEKGMIQEIMPSGSKFHMWHSSYRVLRAVDEVIKDKKPKKFRQVESGSTRGQGYIKNHEVE